MQRMGVILLLLPPPERAHFICLCNEREPSPAPGTLRKDVCMGALHCAVPLMLSGLLRWLLLHQMHKGRTNPAESGNETVGMFCVFPITFMPQSAKATALNVCYVSNSHGIRWELGAQVPTICMGNVEDPGDWKKNIFCTIQYSMFISQHFESCL